MKLEIEMSVTIRMDSGMSLVLTEAEAKEVWKLLDEKFRQSATPKPGSIFATKYPPTVFHGQNGTQWIG